MKHTTVYVVRGTAGEYSDRSEWLVCAYEDEVIARLHAEAARREAQRMHALFRKRGFALEVDDLARAWDPQMKIHHDDTDYTVEPVAVRYGLPDTSPPR